MSKTKQQSKAPDDLLSDLAEAIHPVSEKFELDADYAMFSLGVKVIGEDEDVAVQTYINATGLYGILSEGLYAELADQIQNGDLMLFSILREVVRDLEETFDISPEDDLDVDSDQTRFH